MEPIKDLYNDTLTYPGVGDGNNGLDAKNTVIQRRHRCLMYVWGVLSICFSSAALQQVGVHNNNTGT